MLTSLFRRRYVVLTLGLVFGCGDGDGKGKDAGDPTCSDADCEGMEVPAIACADGPTLVVCERGSDGACHPSVRCENADAGRDGGIVGATCGGIAGLTCGAGTFCNYEKTAGGTGCDGIADAAGVCEKLPSACPDDYSPVCSCDNRTYGNACAAHAAGVASKHTGACTPEECIAAGGRPEYSDGASTPMCKAGEDSFELPGIEPAICCVPDTQSKLSWYRTCGAPVCGNPNQQPSDLPACDSHKAGEACSDEGSECDLQDDCSTHLICASSDPTQGPGGCPISRQESKVDIHYLDATELARKHEEVLGLSIAQYTYKNDPKAEPRLGFIIEDVEPSAFVEEARNRVDLYAYTSAVIAAMQVQEARIRELEAQVRKLSAERARPRRR